MGILDKNIAEECNKKFAPRAKIISSYRIVKMENCGGGAIYYVQKHKRFLWIGPYVWIYEKTDYISNAFELLGKKRPYRSLSDAKYGARQFADSELYKLDRKIKKVEILTDNIYS